MNVQADQRGYASAAKLSAALDEAIVKTMAPPPILTVSQWSDRFAYLSRETSAVAGRFTSFGYQRGPMDAINDPNVRVIVWMKSARIGATRTMDNTIGYFIHQDPCPILVVQPRVEDAEDYSRTEIEPMLRDTPVLSEILGDRKDKDPNQRIAKRLFRNGSSVSFVGANSPGGFRRITARVVLLDEVDGYPEQAGKEGDPVTLATKRTETFWNRKIVMASTPTIKGRSRIEKALAESDMRRYFVPCPTCGHMQVLQWKNLRWDKSESGEHLPDTAHFVCEANGCIIEEGDKPDMIERGKWIAERPMKDGIAGFHIWAAYSLFPNASWRHLVSEFLRVKADPLLLQTFVNLVLGETWEEKTEKVDASTLIHRGENYGPQSIPAGVLLLVAGVDVQGDRLEVGVEGYGLREETWAIEHEVIYGDPAQQQVWDDLDQVLLRSYRSERGQELRVRAACVDTGGHHAGQVLAFCKRRRSRRIFPIKGAGGPRPIWPKRASRTSANETIFIVGVDTGKDTVYGRLRIPSAGPGYMHFPASESFNQTYFEQLTSEVVQTRFREGRPYRVWFLPDGKRNEALDVKVYALAARMSLPIRLDEMGQPPLPPPVDPDTVEGGEEVARPVVDAQPSTTSQPTQQPQLGPPSGIKHSQFVGRRGGWLDRNR